MHAQVMLMDRERWPLNVAVTSTLGMTLMGQYGAMQSAKLAGWISPYPIEAMMLFLPLTMGLHHRVLLVGEARVVMSDRLSLPEAGSRGEPVSEAPLSSEELGSLPETDAAAWAP